MTTWEKVQKKIDDEALSNKDATFKDIVDRKDLFIFQRTNSDTTKVTYGSDLWGFKSKYG